MRLLPQHENNVSCATSKSISAPQHSPGITPGNSSPSSLNVNFVPRFIPGLTVTDRIFSTCIDFPDGSAIYFCHLAKDRRGPPSCGFSSFSRTRGTSPPASSSNCAVSVNAPHQSPNNDRFCFLRPRRLPSAAAHAAHAAAHSKQPVHAPHAPHAPPHASAPHALEPLKPV
jgi:hypothetical protein